MSDAPEELTLIGYEKLAEHGFALPCFGRTVGANTAYVARATQPGDPLAAIAAFDVYEPDDMQQMPPGKPNVRAWIGGPWIDVFLWNGEVIAGSKPEIWQSLVSMRTAIAVIAPLTLLNLAEGVPGEAVGPLARAALAWLEERRGVSDARAWLIGTYLRDIVMRIIRRRLGDTANTERIRQALRQVKLEMKDTRLALRLPFLLMELLGFEADTFSNLSKAAQEFGMPIDLPTRRPVTTTPAYWTKKLSASDAQRKRTGNQRGSITLVQARHKIDAQTYFRRDFFGCAEWVHETTRTGEARESAVIPFRVTFLSEDLGSLPITISYAPNREANQTNYTSLLHLGPLSRRFAERDMTGKWLRFDRQADGTYTLSIQDSEPRGPTAPSRLQE